jgi:hypothetical protein
VLVVPAITLGPKSPVGRACVNAHAQNASPRVQATDLRGVMMSSGSDSGDDTVDMFGWESDEEQGTVAAEPLPQAVSVSVGQLCTWGSGASYQLGHGDADFRCVVSVEPGLSHALSCIVMGYHSPSYPLCLSP